MKLNTFSQPNNSQTVNYRHDVHSENGAQIIENIFEQLGTKIFEEQHQPVIVFNAIFAKICNLMGIAPANPQLKCMLVQKIQNSEKENVLSLKDVYEHLSNIASDESIAALHTACSVYDSISKKIVQNPQNASIGKMHWKLSINQMLQKLNMPDISTIQTYLDVCMFYAQEGSNYKTYSKDGLRSNVVRSPEKSFLQKHEASNSALPNVVNSDFVDGLNVPTDLVISNWPPIENAEKSKVHMCTLYPSVHVSKRAQSFPFGINMPTLAPSSNTISQNPQKCNIQENQNLTSVTPILPKIHTSPQLLATNPSANQVRVFGKPPKNSNILPKKNAFSSQMAKSSNVSRNWTEILSQQRSDAMNLQKNKRSITPQKIRKEPFVAATSTRSITPQNFRRESSSAIQPRSITPQLFLKKHVFASEMTSTPTKLAEVRKLTTPQRSSKPATPLKKKSTNLPHCREGFRSTSVIKTKVAQPYGKEGVPFLNSRSKTPTRHNAAASSSSNDKLKAALKVESKAMATPVLKETASKKTKVPGSHESVKVDSASLKHAKPIHNRQPQKNATNSKTSSSNHVEATENIYRRNKDKVARKYEVEKTGGTPARGFKSEKVNHRSSTTSKHSNSSSAKGQLQNCKKEKAGNS